MIRQWTTTLFHALRRLDWWLLSAIAIMLIAGLLMQYSFSLSSDAGPGNIFQKQVIFTVVGIGLFLFFSMIDQRTVRLKPVWWWAIGLVLLLTVLVFGKEIQGTKGWLVIGGTSLQPVEFVKLSFILFIAHYCEDSVMKLRETRHTIITGAAAAIFIFFILLQPDLGSASILFFVWLAIAAFLRAPKWILVGAVAAVLAFGVFGWFFYFADYQKDRLIVFIEPEQYADGAGYNVIQSMVAVGSGSLWGRGLGAGTQSQLHFLPEVTTDFVFAAYAEEFGYVGVTALLIAIGVLVTRCWIYMRRTRDPFVFVFCLAASLYILIQSTMNIGMNLGILPVTGVPLPLVSSGGTSLLMTLSLLGMVHHQFLSGRVEKRLFSQK